MSFCDSVKKKVKSIVLGDTHFLVIQIFQKKQQQFFLFMPFLLATAFYIYSFNIFRKLGTRMDKGLRC